MLVRGGAAIPYLDGWRGLAILAVLAAHFGPRPIVDPLGQIGVQMFFALSGYLIGQLLFIKNVGLPDFFFRRFSRIVPTFVLFIAAMYLYARYVRAGASRPTVEELLAALFFVRTYLPVDVGIWSSAWPIGHIWSLNVEEHSYLFLALLALVARRCKSERVLTVLLACGVAASALIYYRYAGSPPAGASPWSLRSECAAAGLLFSALLCQMRHARPTPALHGGHPAVPAVFFLLGIYLISGYRLNGGQVVLGPVCLALALNFLFCLPEPAKQLLSHRLLIWFGKRSFSLYLWQQPFYRAVVEGELPALAGAVLGLGAGVLSFHLFEDPVRRGLNRAWSRRGSSAGATQPQLLPVDGKTGAAKL